jgi:hypothetical protein
MSKPKRNQKQDTNTSDTRDRCETPGYALDPIVPFLNPNWRIWEPACGTGRIMRRLSELRFKVTGSDLMEEWQPDQFDAILTNPPYSIKPQWIRRCYQLGKPFALLVPVETIGSGEVQRMMEEQGAEILLLNKRVNYYMPIQGMKKGTGAQFPSLWLCWKILPAPIVYGRITRWVDGQINLLEAIEENQYATADTG